MTLYDFFISILILELLVFICAIFMIFIRRIKDYFVNKKHKKIQNSISEILVNHIAKKEDFKKDLIPLHLAIFEDIIIVLEEFSLRVSGPEYSYLIYQIADSFLLHKARILAYNKKWTKRHLAARCFALASKKDDEKTIFHLFNDISFMVRSKASIAVINLENHEATYELIKKMSIKTDYERLFYRDVLLHKINKIIKWVEEIITKTKDPKIHIACLEIIQSQTSSRMLPILKNDISSKNDTIADLSLKIMANYPLEESIDIILKYIEDKDYQKRKIAAMSLKNYIIEKSLKALQKTLKDENIDVRNQAAKSLKQMGKEGIAILKKTKLEKKSPSYEIAKYALEFY
jgi:hypothetical protein